MDRIDRLRVFAGVVECGGFTRASQRLFVSRSSVSEAVKELERQLGVVLIQRTTRRMALTQEGEAFYERCVRLLADYDEATSGGAGAPAGRVRMSAPSRVASRVLAPELPGFLEAFPQIDLELSASDQAVDLLQDGVDCALRVGRLNDSGLIARRVCDIAMINCAGPGYVAAKGAPRNRDELEAHLVVGYGAIVGPGASWEHSSDGEPRSFPMRCRVSADDAATYIACAVAGLGVIQIPAYDVREELASGRLVEVLPDLRPAPMPVSFVRHRRRHVPRRVEAVMDWAAETLRRRMAEPTASA